MSNTALLGSYGGQGNSSLMFRNKVINGSMTIDQRNAGAAVTITNTAALTYVVDRFYGYCSAASKFSLQRNAGAITPPTGFTNYLGATSLSAYSVASSDEFSLGQAIEGFNIADLAWGTASAQSIAISFWARSSLTGTFSGAVRNNGTTRSYVFTYSISAANTWEYKTVVIPGDTSGTWLADNGVGLYLSFSLGAGATRSTTSGSWQAGSFMSATGATSVVGTNGATLYITGVQLEAETATPFERRPIGQELQLCQRYCFVNRIANFNYIGFGGMETGTVCNVAMVLPQIMRANPFLESFANPSSIMFEYSTGGGMATGYTAIGINTTNNSTSYRLQFTGGTGGQTGAVGAVRSQVAEVKIVISAEL